MSSFTTITIGVFRFLGLLNLLCFFDSGVLVPYIRNKVKALLTHVNQNMYYIKVFERNSPFCSKSLLVYIDTLFDRTFQLKLVRILKCLTTQERPSVLQER